MSAGRPLAGRRIVVTRSRAQAHTLSALLEADGAEVIEIPVIRLSPPPDYGPLDRAIDQLAGYDWIVFTSQNAVRALIDRLSARGRDAASLARSRIASIGPATARALEAYGLRPALVPPGEYVAEALLRAFAAEHRESLGGARVLLPRALDARPVLPDGLRALGAVVDVVPAYRVEVERQQDPATWGRVLSASVDAVTFTSPSTVRSFVDLVGPEASRVLGTALVACIGPVTAQAARACGLAVGAIAPVYTVQGLAEVLRRRFAEPAAAQKPLEVEM